MIGVTLSNRYRLLEKTGEGGMAIVYKAKDALLGRTVAVKVLRSQFASDEEFVERFRREAMSAASLSHPNVVNIYDVGQDEQTYFIVMEFVDGINLKCLIKEKAPMQITEVVGITRQIVEALEHAHNHDIVHRDIKPHNILITKDGRVKVTDFGIARAASKSSLTQTGMVMGSVHYFSPEQASGTSIGVQSDLYSVGVVLFEMITGTVPFKGDTPISIALAHIQDAAPPVRSLVPGVPLALERVVDRALVKDLDKRYETAASMLRDLYIAGAQAHELTLAEIEATRVVTSSGIQRNEETVDEPTLIKSRAEMGRKKTQQGTQRMRAFLIAGALLLMVLVGLGVRGILVGQPEIEVPQYEGTSFTSARRDAQELGLVLVKDGEAYDSRVPARYIVSQQPPAGRIVKRGRHVLVVISKGAERVIIPNLVGLKFEAAETLIRDSELTLGVRSDVFSSEVALGLVLAQSPSADADVDKDSPVDLVVSKGPEPINVVVPNLIGLSLEEALDSLDLLGLEKGKVVTEFSDTVSAGVILEQYPDAEAKVEKGQVVNLVVSKREETPEDINTDETKRYSVSATVPDGQPSQEVSIVVSDAIGTRTVYREKHDPGDKIDKVIEAVSPGVIEVYVSGQLVKREPI